MNEEYNIYYSNYFGRLKNIFMTAHRNMMRENASRKVENLNTDMDDIVSLKESYDEDISRLRVLENIIKSLKSRIEICGNCTESPCESREDRSRLAGALNRRKAEYKRLEKEIEEKYDRISDLLKDNAGIRPNFSRVTLERSVCGSRLCISCCLL